MFIFFDVIKKEAFRVCQSSTVINVLGFKNYNQVMIGNLRRWLQLVLPLCQDLLLSISIHILGVSVKLIFIFECLQRVSWCMLVDMAKNGGDVAISIFTKAGMYSIIQLLACFFTLLSPPSTIIISSQTRARESHLTCEVSSSAHLRRWCSAKLSGCLSSMMSLYAPRLSLDRCTAQKPIEWNVKDYRHLTSPLYYHKPKEIDALYNALST